MTQPMSPSSSAHFDSRRRERHSTLAAAREQQTRVDAEVQLDQLHISLLTAARNVRKHQTHEDHLDARQIGHAAALATLPHPTGMIETLLLGPIQLIVVLVVDVLVLFAAAREILALAYDTGVGPPLGVTIGVPTTLIGIELALACRIAHYAKRVASGDTTARAGLTGSRALGVGMAVVTPALAMAPFFADTVADHGVAWWLLAIGITALGIVCHCLVIFGGNTILPALERSIRGPVRAWIASEIRRVQGDQQRSRDIARDAMRRYSGAVASYTRTFGAPPQHLLIQPADSALVNDAVGEVLVVNPGPPPGAGTEPTPAPGATGPVPTRPQAPPQAGTAERPRTNESAAEADYLRQILVAQQRNADGEVRP